MKIKQYTKNKIKNIIQSSGLTIKGHHFIYPLKTQTQNKYIIEIIGLGGKTTLLKKMSKSGLQLYKIKPNYLEENLKLRDYGNQKHDKNLMMCLISEAIKSNNSFYRVVRIVEKLIVQTEYKLNVSFLTDEGLIKENLDLLVNVLKQDGIDIPELLKDYRFIVILPTIEQIVARYYKRKKTPEHKKAKFQEYLIKQQNLTLEFISYLNYDEDKFIILSDNDRLNIEKAMNFIHKI